MSNELKEFTSSDRHNNQVSMTWKGLDVKVVMQDDYGNEIESLVSSGDTKAMYAFLQQRDLDDRYSNHNHYQFIRQNKIQLIKFLRAISPGLSLKDAKDKLDDYELRLLCQDDTKVKELEQKQREIERAQAALAHALRSLSEEDRKKWLRHQSLKAELNT